LIKKQFGGYQSIMLQLLDREKTVAAAGFNRWMVPPAALCIHLCIGMAYGFSVFWLPLTRAIGIDHSVLAPENLSFWDKLFTTQYDWDKPSLGWIYTLFFVFLGASAAWMGRWLEEVGPRVAGIAAACFWGGGLVIASIGVYLHQLWLLWLGAGVIGGIGLGLGYISPVSTLIKWFPDRRGMATGLAIMGFGGGAMIGSPLADRLMRFFSNVHSVGVWQTFLVLSVIYFTLMTLGAFAYRIPPHGWRPSRWTPDASTQARSNRYVSVSDAWKTPQFLLLWLVLCLNVSAGIGVLGMASPLLQEVFGGKLIGSSLEFSQLEPDQLKRVATLGAAFTGLLSLFNILGRFFWATLSDYFGRKSTYTVFFLLGCFFYALVPAAGKYESPLLFIMVLCLILTMYGGGFATIPAYLSDLFGTQMVGAIHGRLLTAWSVAGVFGPVMVNYLNAYQIRNGVSQAQAYDQTMYVLASLMVAGFVCNLLIRPVASELFLQATSSGNHDALLENTSANAICWESSTNASNFVLLTVFWLLVLLPMSWGLWVTLQNASVLLYGYG
jgi:MFS family permease